jgi:glycosyltransferase involved in cell wall biosynthesis
MERQQLPNANQTPVRAKKRILYVEQNQDGTVGGSHFCLLEIVQNLDRRRFEPLVIFYEPNFLIPEFQKVAEVVIVSMPQPMKTAANGYGQLWRGFATGLRKAINGVRLALIPVARWVLLMSWRRIDLVHLNNGAQVHAIWLIAAKLSRTKCVTHQRGYAPARRNWFYVHFDKIISISDQIRRHLVEHTPSLDKSIVVIHDGLDINVFRNKIVRNPQDVRKEFDIPADSYLMGMVGNIKQWKGQAVVVEALKRLEPRLGDFHCLLIGSVSSGADDKAYDEYLRQLIRSYGLDKKVTLTGGRSDVPDLMNALDVVVHASIEPEPLGRVIFEGMALGKPVIATDHGGPKEILQNGESGFLVTPNDPEQLASCLSRLMESPTLAKKIGQSGYERVATEFSIARNISKIQDVYAELLYRR